MVTDAPMGSATISTWNAEIDKKMGGGIPMGSLTLVEGQSDAGKSVSLLRTRNTESASTTAAMSPRSASTKNNSRPLCAHSGFCPPARDTVTNSEPTSGKAVT